MGYNNNGGKGKERGTPPSDARSAGSDDVGGAASAPTDDARKGKVCDGKASDGAGVSVGGGNIEGVGHSSKDFNFLKTSNFSSVASVFEDGAGQSKVSFFFDGVLQLTMDEGRGSKMS
jgi:hypothetical protein